MTALQPVSSDYSRLLAFLPDLAPLNVLHNVNALENGFADEGLVESAAYESEAIIDVPSCWILVALD